ncbi:MAG: SDR family oxidoreductase [Gammaproteobacteria bacterium]|nr:SDR family oxidoreductase [Gammaproteobacteria bacterium]
MNTVLITGANKGIGREMVEQYHQEGWYVIACTRKPDQLEHKDERLQILEIDVTQPEDIKKLSGVIKDLSIDILINNAGVWGPSEQNVGSIDCESWLKAFKVNTIAPLLIAQTLLPQIAKSKLKIIANMSSTMGSINENTSGGDYVYRSSKAALNMVTKTLSVDLKNDGVTVISLHPGWVKTDMGGTGALLTPEESVKGIRKVLASVRLEDSGSFIRYDGNKASW